MVPKVYIIIINFNGQADTIECLESILKLNYLNFQVIVVDNSVSENSLGDFKQWSNDNTYPIKTAYTNIVTPPIQKPIDIVTINETASFDRDFLRYTIIIIKALNRGFAAANNVALKFIKQANDYTHVWLLNNDTIVEKNSLSELYKSSIDSKNNVGMWGSKLMMYYRPTIIQGVGGRYNKWFGIVNETGFMQEDRGQWDHTKFKFDYVIGASMFIKKEFIEDVGLMEEDYFLYYEELDWAIRARKKGWTLGFCPQSKVYHKMGASINNEDSKGNSILADFYSSRNRILITKKYFPFMLLTLYPAFLKFVVTRIYYRQFTRILMLFKIMVNPKNHITP